MYVPSVGNISFVLRTSSDVHAVTGRTWIRYVVVGKDLLNAWPHLRTNRRVRGIRCFSHAQMALVLRSNNCPVGGLGRKSTRSVVSHIESSRRPHTSSRVPSCSATPGARGASGSRKHGKPPIDSVGNPTRKSNEITRGECDFRKFVY